MATPSSTPGGLGKLGCTNVRHLERTRRPDRVEESSMRRCTAAIQAALIARDLPPCVGALCDAQLSTLKLGPIWTLRSTSRDRCCASPSWTWRYGNTDSIFGVSESEGDAKSPGSG